MLVKCINSKNKPSDFPISLCIERFEPISKSVQEEMNTEILDLLKPEKLDEVFDI